MEWGKMMREVYRAFKKRSEEQMDPEIRISPEQFGILHAIYVMEREVIQQELAEILGKDKSVILRMVDNLEEKDLVRRVSGMKDRRKNYLMLTKAGNRVMDHYKTIVAGLMKDFQEGLSESQIDTFNQVISHIRKNAEKV